MKAYQVVENGKPLEEKEVEPPFLQGKKYYSKQYLAVFVIQTFIFMTDILILAEI